MKIIDAVVPAADLVKTAKDWIKAGGKAKNPWDVDGFRLPGGLVYSKAGMMNHPGRQRHLSARDLRQLSAARAILQVVYEGLATADGPRAACRIALVRENPAFRRKRPP